MAAYYTSQGVRCAAGADLVDPDGLPDVAALVSELLRHPVRELATSRPPARASSRWRMTPNEWTRWQIAEWARRGAGLRARGVERHRWRRAVSGRVLTVRADRRAGRVHDGGRDRRRGARRARRLLRLDDARHGGAASPAPARRLVYGARRAAGGRRVMSLGPGKLPAAMLAELLGGITHRDPRVLLGPGIGRDAAVIDMGGDRCLVAKTDPVTFAADEIGWYAVHVNANDIACMGARPAWFLATALLPPGADDDLPATIFDQISAACGDLGIELVGGHTEVTIGLDRPIVVGAMLGEAARDEIVSGEGIRARRSHPDDARDRDRGHGAAGARSCGRAGHAGRSGGRHEPGRRDAVRSGHQRRRGCASVMFLGASTPDARSDRGRHRNGAPGTRRCGRSNRAHRRHRHYGVRRDAVRSAPRWGSIHSGCWLPDRSWPSSANPTRAACAPPDRRGGASGTSSPAMRGL